MTRHCAAIAIPFLTCLLAGCAASNRADHVQEHTLSTNKHTIERYMEGFRRSDHAMVLSCLTDDVEWVIPGMFHVTGKAAFDKEIENDAFVGRPAITISLLVEEDNVVIAEGTVRATKRAGGNLNLKFCDVFTMQGGKIQHLVSYLMEVKEPGQQ